VAYAAPSGDARGEGDHPAAERFERPRRLGDLTAIVFGFRPQAAPQQQRARQKQPITNGIVEQTRQIAVRQRGDGGEQHRQRQQQHQHPLGRGETAGGLLVAFGHDANSPFYQQNQGGQRDQYDAGQQQKAAHGDGSKI
jgi:hypothetical protein